MIKKDKIIDAIGIFLVVFGLFSIFLHISSGRAIYLLWYCNHVHILLGTLILLRKRYWVNAVLNIGLIPVTLWIIDYISQVVFHYNLFGIVDYLFIESDPLFKILIHQHLFVIPLGIIALWLMGGAVKDSWKGSLMYGALLAVISLPVDPVYKMNCIRASCISFMPSTASFIVLQLGLIVLAILSSYWLLRKIKHGSSVR